MAELTGLTTRSIRTAIDGLLSKNLIIVAGDEKKVKLFAVNFTAVNDVETDVTAMELALKDAEVISKDEEVISHDAEVISKDEEAYFLHNKQTKDTNTKDKKDRQQTKSKNKFELVKPDDVSDEVWGDLLSHRKSKKASNTQTAWKMIFNQLDIAKRKSGHSSEQIISEWLARDWRGFKADWYLNTIQQPTNQKANSDLPPWQQTYVPPTFNANDIQRPVELSEEEKKRASEQLKQARQEFLL